MRWQRDGVVSWLLLLLLLAGNIVEGRMSNEEFSSLLNRFSEGSKQLSDESFHLLYNQVNTMFWNNPNSLNKGLNNSLENAVYSVILYDIPPYVKIKDIEGVRGDPGNVNQTRTPHNGGLTGITVEFLSLVEYHTGAIFKYYYPCRQQDRKITGKCNAEKVRKDSEALSMLGSDSESTFFGGNALTLCGGNNTGCFSAGAHRISESLLIRYSLTQPILMTGYRLITLAVPDEPKLFDWALPFDWIVWIIIGAEILFCGVAIFIIEYKAKNPTLSSTPIMRLWDSVYFSTSIILRISHQQVVTHGGRTIVLAQLFLALILQAIFVIGQNYVVQNKYGESVGKSNLDSIEDYFYRRAPKFINNNSICYPSTDLVAKNYLDLKAGLADKDVTINFVTAPDFKSCLKLVYTGKVTATFDDALTAQTVIGNDFLKKGRCGPNGGYCSEWSISKELCHCFIPDPLCTPRGATGAALESQMNVCPPILNKTCNRTFTPRASTLTAVGDIFNPVGHALVFPRSVTSQHHLAFNQFLIYAQEQGEFGHIIKRASVVPECASGVGVVPQVKLWNVVGLFIIVASVLVVGFAIGITEIIYRCSCAQLACCKKKVAVEPKVQGCMQYRMLTSRPSRVFPPILLNFFL